MARGRPSRLPSGDWRRTRCIQLRGQPRLAVFPLSSIRIDGEPRRPQGYAVPGGRSISAGVTRPCNILTQTPLHGVLVQLFQVSRAAEREVKREAGASPALPPQRYVYEGLSKPLCLRHGKADPALSHDSRHEPGDRPEVIVWQPAVGGHTPDIRPPCLLSRCVFLPRLPRPAEGHAHVHQHSIHFRFTAPVTASDPGRGQLPARHRADLLRRVLPRRSPAQCRSRYPA